MLYCVNRVKKEKKAGQRTAGVKAPDDITVIARNKCKAKIIEFEEHQNTHKFLRPVDLVLRMGVNISNYIRLKSRVRQGDTVIIQHPYSGIRGLAQTIRECRKKGVRFIFFIHDLLSLRKNIERKNSDRENRIVSEQEFELLNLCDAIICHNEKMKKYLTDNGVPAEKIVCLEIFDYLITKKTVTAKKNDKSVVVAGNLAKEKSAYIYKMSGDNGCKFHLNLYGPNYTETEITEDTEYMGILPPEELPSQIKGAYGLVWDGDSIETCSGVAGEYLRINNPHKCSLYLVSGLPVIVWKQSALAEFIEKNGLGIAVDSIPEISGKIDSVTEEEYNTMCGNVAKVRKKLTGGKYFTEALRKALEIAEGNR
ncbi:MAG: glycosyltransferase [Ruminococcus sp.]|nr:glycosyltransferase [Ruminococcus sp.]